MKIIRSFAALLAVLMVVSCVLLAGCQAYVQTQYEVPNYQGQLKDGQTKSDFNQELFYRNDKKAGCPDPFVLDNTSRDGYYYLYGTEGSLYCYRSKDLMDWERVGNALDNMDYASPGVMSEIRLATWKDIWAPEVVYDPDEQLYYMFFSATPKADEEVKTGNGSYLMMVAVSRYPDRDFQLVNFEDAASCGAENVHSYDKNKYPHYYAKYQFFDPVDYNKFIDEGMGGNLSSMYGGYVRGIDPHPYVDENGDKYLFWVDSLSHNGIETTRSSNRICVVKMENWLKPDWNTATVLMCHKYYTVEDWVAAQSGQSVETVTYEPKNRINEGPFVVKHNDKYYLTFSVGSYADSSYQVAQAVSDNIMGPYRKLTEAEGGVLMSGNTSGSQEISGTGHHSFITVGGKMYMIYHRHNDAITAGSARNPAIDEVKWIKIKDKDGNDLDVLYSNGPTCTVQPRIEAFADYVNIAPEATVSGSEDAKYLSDGLLSIYKYADPDFMEYVKETTITESTTFTFDFAEARVVRAVMVYNSKMEYSAFTKVARVEFVCEEDGKEVVRFIKDIQFSAENYQANDFDGSLYYIISGSAAYAEFEELNVKSIRITMEVPEGQETVGISEVRILGK
jgi:GH43 family beta-xylosidase